MLRILAACAIVLGLLLPLLLLGSGPADPLYAYRAATGGARADAVVTEVGAATVKVRHARQRAGASPVHLDDYGLDAPGWRDAFKPGDRLSVAYLTTSPASNVVPAVLLDELPEPAETGWLLPLVVFLIYVSGGIALLVSTLRAPKARTPGPSGAEPDPRARAVAYKIAAGVAVMLLLPVALAAVPAYLEITGSASASTGWPQVPGTIIEARVEKQVSRTRRGGEHISYAPLVTARYLAGERHWRTRIVRFNYLESGDEDDAAAVVARYRIGNTVAVRHDPAQPSRAVLEPGLVMPEAALYGAGAALAVLSILALLWWLRRPLPPTPSLVPASRGRRGKP